MPLAAWVVAAACVVAAQSPQSSSAPAAPAAADTARDGADKDGPPSEPAPIRIGPILLSGYAQLDGLFDVGEHDRAHDGTFRVRRARAYVSGDMAPGIGFMLSVDAAASQPLREAYVTLRHVPAANIRVGEFVTPYSLERITSTKELEAIDRVIDHLTPGRDIGVEVFNAAPFRGHLSYSAAAVNGSGQNAHDDNNAKDFIGRLVWRLPRTRVVSVGVNAASGKEPTGTRTRWGADLNIERGDDRVAAEYLHQVEADWEGRAGHGFYLLARHRFRPATPRPDFYMAEAMVRVVDIRDISEVVGGLVGAERREVQTGANYYFSRSVRVMAEASVPLKRLAGVPRTTIMTRVQFMF